MSQQETFEKLRVLRSTGSPEIKMVADAISALVDQVSRVSGDVMKLKNEVQALRSSVASRGRG